MKRMIPVSILSLVVPLGMVAMESSTQSLAAQREIRLAPAYTSLVVATEEDVSVRVTVANRGRGL